MAEHLLGIYRQLRLVVEELSQARGWTSSQLMALRYVALEPDTSMNDLTLHLCVTRPAVTSIVDRLELEGLIERRPGTDRRIVHLRLTAKGEQAVTSLRSELHARIQQWIGVMPAGLSLALEEGLAALSDSAQSETSAHHG